LHDEVTDDSFRNRFKKNSPTHQLILRQISLGSEFKGSGLGHRPLAVGLWLFAAGSRHQ